MTNNPVSSISIVELDYHIECLYSLCTLFRELDLQVKIFTKMNIYEELHPVFREQSYEWFIYDSEQDELSNYLELAEKEINKTDLLFFSTLESRFREFNAMDIRAFSVMRIHNAHTYLDPLHYLAIEPSLKYLFKGLSYLIREEIFKQRSLNIKKAVQNADMLMFPDESITEYVKQHFDLGEFAPVVPPLPMAIPTGDSSPKDLSENEALRIVIPGSIDKARRDYGLFMDAVKILRDKVNRPVVVKLLGRDRGRYSNKVRKQLRALQTENLRFEFSGGRVPQEEFIREMKGAHLLLNPIRVNTTYKIFREIYGKTKISGAITDIFRYQKPLITSRDYKVSEELRPCVELYADAKVLADTLLKYLEPNYMSERNAMVKEVMESILWEQKVKDFFNSVKQLEGLNHK